MSSRNICRILIFLRASKVEIDSIKEVMIMMKTFHSTLMTFYFENNFFLFQLFGISKTSCDAWRQRMFNNKELKGQHRKKIFSSFCLSWKIKLLLCYKLQANNNNKSYVSFFTSQHLTSKYLVKMTKRHKNCYKQRQQIF